MQYWMSYIYFGVCCYCKTRVEISQWNWNNEFYNLCCSLSESWWYCYKMYHFNFSNQYCAYIEGVLTGYTMNCRRTWSCHSVAFPPDQLTLLVFSTSTVIEGAGGFAERCPGSLVDFAQSITTQHHSTWISFIRCYCCNTVNSKDATLWYCVLLVLPILAVWTPRVKFIK